MIIKPNSRILFQGDSVTDAGRDREDFISLAPGSYPAMVAERFRALYPELPVEFLNRSVSGDTSEMMAARWQTDCMDLQPDIVSVLVGINDTWRACDGGAYTSPEKYVQNLSQVLDQVKSIHAQIIIMTPFLLPAEDKLRLRDDLNGKLAAIRSLAEKYADVFVELDKTFQTLVSLGAPWNRFTPDGIHPNERGCEIIADRWLQEVGAAL